MKTMSYTDAGFAPASRAVVLTSDGIGKGTAVVVRLPSV
jgi:hypothetical protein